jgi:hypothetical protein
MHLIDKNAETTVIQQAYTTLHRIQHQIRLQTGKRIQKIAQGAIPWSPDYKQHCEKLNFGKEHSNTVKMYELATQF